MRQAPTLALVIVLSSAADANNPFAGLRGIQLNEEGDLELAKRETGELVDIAVPAAVAKRNVRRYCGEQLVATLQLVCHKYGRKKRSAAGGMMYHTSSRFPVGTMLPDPIAAGSARPGRDGPTALFGEAEENEVYVQGIRDALRGMMMATRTRPEELPMHVNKRGVTAECCDKACSLATLVTFC